MRKRGRFSRSGGVQRWDGVRSVYHCEFSEEEPLRVLLPGMPVEGELEVPFVASGYYDPGRIYGDPDDCYPPEGEDERLPDGNASIFYKGEDGKYLTIELTKEQTDEMFDAYDEEIQGVEVDYSAYEDDGPDPDDMRDERFFGRGY